jgi:hypothetical protein
LISIETLFLIHIPLTPSHQSLCCVFFFPKA